MHASICVICLYSILSSQNPWGGMLGLYYSCWPTSMIVHFCFMDIDCPLLLEPVCMAVTGVMINYFIIRSLIYVACRHQIHARR